MASISKKGNGFYIRITIHGTERKIYGFRNERDAIRTGQKLEDLKAGLMAGQIPPEIVKWVATIRKEYPARYDKFHELGLVERRIEAGTLAELVEIFTTDDSLKERTLLNRRSDGNMVKHFFGEGRRVDSLTRSDADELYKHMRETLAVGTYQRRIKTVKAIFKQAVEMKWIRESPFEHLKGGNKANRERDFFVTEEMAGHILEACPDSRWRLIFTFARWGGLRMPSELVFLKWSDILWNQGKFRISIPKKTDKESEAVGALEERFFPLFPEIRRALEEYWETLPEGAPDEIFPDIDKSDATAAYLRKRITGIVRKSGVPVWPKIFTNLRATRDTELQNRYPLRLVCEWMGHSPEVSLKHYAQITDEDFLQASGMAEESDRRKKGRVLPQGGGFGAFSNERNAESVGAEKGACGGGNGGVNGFTVKEINLQENVTSAYKNTVCVKQTPTVQNDSSAKIPSRGVEPL